MKRTIVFLILTLILTSATMAAHAGSGDLGGGAADFTLVWLLGSAYIVGRMLRKGRQGAAFHGNQPVGRHPGPPVD